LIITKKLEERKGKERKIRNNMHASTSMCAHAHTQVYVERRSKSR